MSTHATARIQSDKDFIDFHTRWDGFEDYTRKIFKDLIPYWKGALDIFEKKSADTIHEYPDLKSWMEDFKSFIASQEVAPTLHGLGALYGAQSFNHYAPLNHQSSYEYDDYSYDKDLKTDPDFVLKTKCMSEGNSEWKICRIHSEGEIIDFNYSGSQVELAKAILTLPRFWNELHTNGKLKKGDLGLSDKEVLRAENLPIFGHIGKLDQFKAYKGNKWFSGLYKSKDTSESERIKAALETVIMLIPFDLGCSSFVNHLALRMPGKVFPQKYSEINLERKPDFEIGLELDRISDITITVKTEDLDGVLKNSVPILAKVDQCGDLSTVTFSYEHEIVILMNAEKSVIKKSSKPKSIR